MDSHGPLILDDVAEGAWESFQSVGRPPAARELTACWSRAQALGAPALGAPPEEHLLRGEALRVHAEPVEILRALGEPVIERVTARAAASQHVLLLADADGVIVHVGGGGEFADSARRLRLVEGACWSEALRGTNAIGTAVEMNRATTVRGRAHFARPYHGLVCYAAPIRGLDGRPLAVLDATSMVEVTDPSLAVAVAEAAHALEEIVRLRAYAGAGASVRRILLGSLDRLRGPALLVEAPGRVARANPAARALLGLDPVGSPAMEVLGSSFRRILDEARGAGHPGDGSEGGSENGRDKIIVEIGRQSFRIHGEPIESAGGVPLAVLVEFEPVSRGIASARSSRGSDTRVSTGPQPVEANPGEVRGDGTADPFAGIFAEDPAVIEAKRWARRLAESAVPVMLLAETGAGKDLFAQAIHAASGRRAGPFVAVNCGSVAPGLLESELFGYAPGAFTGAERAGRSGLLEAARGGTLFLDEVADMPPPMQVALLRVLETGTFRRVGAVRTEHTDARILCATCRDLPGLVACGSFRPDLFYRLKGATLGLPPLRRRTDTAALAGHLLRARGRSSGAAERVAAPFRLGAAAERAIAGHPWPGNVRELKATLEVALLMADSEGTRTIEIHHLPAEIAASPGARVGASPGLLAARLATAERLHPWSGMAVDAPSGDAQPAATDLLARSEAAATERALSESAWNMSRAARQLGVARSTLYRMVRRHGLQPSPVPVPQPQSRG
jgi:transcriptional regulator of acetoin/glycerol metabolism